MVIWTNARKIGAVALGTGAGLSAYFYQKIRDPQSVVHLSWTNSEKPVNPCALWDSNWDCRSPKSLVKPPKNDSPQEQNRYNSELEKSCPKFARHIILIRHGEYLDLGDSDETHRLTTRGRLQAEYTGKRLREMGIKWDKVIASTMTRAQETAEIILKEIDFNPKDVKHCPYIREGAPIPPQPPVGHWRPEESFFRDGARIEAGFRRYFYRALPTDKHDTYTLIVGHGNVIRYFVCRALQFPPEAWLRINVNHASITWLTIQPSGNVTIKYLGDTGFIPAQYLTNRIPREAKNVV
ncbi:phosphoglycerate mutase 5 isoform X1 [Haematobia irritans]|uniref:phosphoglycerate mutase 5 isoform X1 n=1 Tax=Haematobia irritans TaxID=7368 RepID=UPI003F50C906